ncbi:MAG: hypothetical protein HC875_31725 [Anaerolineales bacterium]|nr:hypothetical protein [Anaerolineales bacterium]
MLNNFNANGFLVPAVRGIMGDWIYYLSFLKVKQLSEKVRVNASPEIVSEAEQISQYLLEAQKPFLSPIILSVDRGYAKWYELAIQADVIDEIPFEHEGILGLLCFENSVEFVVIKGHSQVQGIRFAFKDAGDKLENQEVSVIFIGRFDDETQTQDLKELEVALKRFS